VFFWYLLVTVVPFLVVSWRTPNTYPTGGVRRGTATQIPRDLGQPHGSFPQEVVGESFNVAAFARLLKGVRVDSSGVDVREKASLVPEPRNEFDPLAVAIVIRGETVGHLPGADAARFQPILLAAVKAGQNPQVDALIYARADEKVPGKVWHSVRLDLAAVEVITGKA
jgi:hypothetical protein